MKNWQKIVEAFWKKRAGGITLPLAAMESLCIKCAEKMEASGMTSLHLKEALPEEMKAGLCDKFNPADGFFSRCTEAELGDFDQDDKEAFCAWLHHECTGKWPAENVESYNSTNGETNFSEAVTIESGRDGRWEVVLFKYGASKRPPHYIYDKSTFINSLAVLSGARVYANSAVDNYGHTKPANKTVRDQIGWIEEPFATENDARGYLRFLPSGKWFEDNLKFLESHNKLNQYELSIDAFGKAKPLHENGRTRLLAESFNRADIDVVSRGAAGGKFVKFTESFTGEKTMKAKLALLFALLFPKYLEAKGIDPWQLPDENELFTHLREADKPSPVLHLPDGMTSPTESWIDDKLKSIRESLVPKTPPSEPPAPATAKATGDANFQESINQLNSQMQQIMLNSCQNLLAVKLTESKLPEPAKAEIRKRYAGVIFQESELNISIEAVRKMIGELLGARVNNQGMDVRIKADNYDRFIASLEAFFLTSPQSLNPVVIGSDEYKNMVGTDTVPFRSIQEAYIQFTGDKNVTGKRDPSAQRFTESLVTSDWSHALANTMNRRLVRDYAMLGLDTWRAFTSIVPLSDFKEQTRVRLGGYPNLPIVAEGAAYLALSSPDDEKAVYSPAKRGGTEDITLEMIKNDDVASIQKIPTRLARAAGHTLHEFVYDFINPSVNPTIYDSKALYHSDHKNIGTLALGANGLAATRLRMRQQTMAGSLKRLGLRLRYIAIPSDIEQTAYGLVTSAFNMPNTTPSFLQNLGIVPVVVDYWDDADDWVGIADRADVEGLEIGFVDGKENPEIIISDLPNAGSWFTNDVQTFKIRHIYGGAVIDFRAFDGSIVAS